MTDKHDMDERLRRTLGSPRSLDVESFTKRTMARLREERQNEVSGGWWRRMILPARTRRWVIPVMAAAGVAVVVFGFMMLMKQSADTESPDRIITAILTPEPTVMIAAATPLAGMTVNYGPPVPSTRAAAPLADTNPETILLEGAMALVAQNDPTLRPHSIWDQTR